MEGFWIGFFVALLLVAIATACLVVAGVTMGDSPQRQPVCNDTSDDSDACGAADRQAIAGAYIMGLGLPDTDSAVKRIKAQCTARREHWND